MLKGRKRLDMIHLIDDFYLDQDERQYMLCRWNGYTVDKRTGVPDAKSYRFIQDLPDVFLHLLKITTRRKIGTLKDISEIAQAVKEENERITALFNNFLEARIAD